MTGNDFMSWLLQSPFHGIMSNGILLITVTGRKTGRGYTTPVSYYRDNGYLWVITSRNRTWWRNVCGGAQVSLLLKRKPMLAFAETELEQKDIEAQLHEYLKYFPPAAKPMGIRMENGTAHFEDIARTAKERLFVRIKTHGS